MRSSINEDPFTRTWSVGRLTRIYTQKLCIDTGCSLEDRPEAMDDRNEWREIVREISASSMTWWWWWWWWWWRSLLTFWFFPTAPQAKKAVRLWSHMNFFAKFFNWQGLESTDYILCRGGRPFPLKKEVSLNSISWWGSCYGVVCCILSLPLLPGTFWPGVLGSNLCVNYICLEIIWIWLNRGKKNCKKQLYKNVNMNLRWIQFPNI